VPGDKAGESPRLPGGSASRRAAAGVPASTTDAGNSPSEQAAAIPGVRQRRRPRLRSGMAVLETADPSGRALTQSRICSPLTCERTCSPSFARSSSRTPLPSGSHTALTSRRTTRHLQGARPRPAAHPPTRVGKGRTPQGARLRLRPLCGSHGGLSCTKQVCPGARPGLLHPDGQRLE